MMCSIVKVQGERGGGRKDAADLSCSKTGAEK